ncbi:salivary glue protein Sgs-3-like [Mizuhopecten yessoensis]|uniref:salivary glue protein Sgs-3-like n=1 Tax=Mizuhopecten yessoensis TaxID=6573 RepID=UPI000B45F000|nr:salivary glue protein Sgs-3-like [Mizuhopecten yessoensis]
MLGITDDSSCGEGGTGKVMDIQSSPVRQEFGTGSGNSFNWTSCSAQQFTTRLASDGACLNNLAQPAYYDDDRLLGGAGTSISIDRQCQIAYGFDSPVCNVPVDPDTFCTDGITCLNSTNGECVNMFVFEGTSCNSSPGNDYWCQDGFCVLEPRTTTTTNPTTTTTTPTTTTTTPITTTTTPTTTTTTPTTTTTTPTTPTTTPTTPTTTPITTTQPRQLPLPLR